MADLGPWPHRLYRMADVAHALGPALEGAPGHETTAVSWDDATDGRASEDTEHHGRLKSILATREHGCWREVTGPAPEAAKAVHELAKRAPHFDALSELIKTNIAAARNMAVPTFLAPVLLVGQPGVGKTWFLTRLCQALGLPFREYQMSSSTLGEGLSGSHPSWRNAGPGLVAKTLLQERFANPVFFIDEVDKVQSHSHNSDPHRPFYTLLEPAGARAFVDEYLTFPIDASRILWVLAANDPSALPPAILDRLTLLDLPEMTQEQRFVVIRSIYEDANAYRRHCFEPSASDGVLGRLSSLTPRSARLAIEHAMARAAADGRWALREDDIHPRLSREPGRIGFR